MEAYGVLKHDLMNDELLDKPPAFSQEWFSEMLDYNVPGGKLNRGMAVYDVLFAIKGADLSEADIFKANALGWCIEWLQAFFLVADDIMDSSITRRGHPCWYKQEKVGLIACNDYILLECCIYRIIKKYLAGHPAYIEITDLFHDVTYQTSHGQLLDTVTAAQGKVDFVSQYTIENYMRIVTYKTAFYSFYLPVACGMHLAGIKDVNSYKVAEKILVEMGQYFQIQDDYLDCYGSPEVIGKIGTDIEVG
jgi:farnesyl diphosphate synthase